MPKKYLQPTAILTSICLIFTLLTFVYTFWQSWGRANVSLEVSYSDDSFPILAVADDSPLATIRSEAKTIVAIDNLPISEAAGKLYVTEIPDHTSGFFLQVYNWPYPMGTNLKFVSAKASKLTVLLTSGQEEVFDITANQEYKTLELNRLAQALISLVFWLTGAVFFVLRPNYSITLSFNLYFNFTVIYLVLQTEGDIYKNDFSFVLVALCSVLSSLGFLYFCLVFPYGNRLTGKKARIFLVICILVTLLNLTCVALYFGFQRNFLPIARVLWALRLYVFVLSFFGGWFILLRRMYKSKGLERNKIKLATLTYLVCCIPPLVLVILSAVFGLFTNIADNYFTFVCLHTVLIPIVFLYSVVKHQLFYTEAIARNFLTYLILSLLLILVYWFSSILISLVITSVLGFASDGFLFLIFVVMALTVSRLEALARSVVNRLFYRDLLNYTQLISKWTSKLLFSHLSLADLLILLLGGLTKDFRFQKLAFLLVENPYYQDDLSQITPVKQKTNGKLYLITIGGSYSRCEDSVLGRLLDAKKLFDNQIGVTLFDTHSMIEPNNLLMLDESFSQDYQSFIPFSKDSIVWGGLLLGSKLGDFTPPLEEQTTLDAIVQQVALAIDLSVKVQLEQSRRQLIQGFVLQQDLLADRKKQAIAREVHDTVMQDIIAVKLRLQRMLSANPNKELVRECYNFSKQAEEHLRETVAELLPRTLDFGILVAFQEFLDYQNKHSNGKSFNLISDLSDAQEEMLEDWFDEEALSNLYRLICEAVNNSIKHADATLITVQITLQQSHQGSFLNITVQDNGKGFDSLNFKGSLDSGHYGLVFMEARAKFLSGKLAFENMPEGGALVHLSIPVTLAKEKIYAKLGTINY